MNKNIELLSPAGTYEAFIAAVENGADAVYLGGKLFNARANASNFGLDELKNIVEYAHLRNVKIFLTLNTLLDDQEIREALDFAFDLYRIGIDAVIVQDLGLASLLHEYIPDLELHASTQMTIYDLAGVNKLKELGFSRVVLARELSFEQIKYIADNTDIEIEIFAHGAQCISYSGQCLMSSMIGDRSGNRGKCAGPCRLPYTLLKDNEPVGAGYLLSPKDLSMLDVIDKIPNIKSLKLEGRMKSPEYVATITRIYRKYIDAYLNNSTLNIDKQDSQDITQIFNRGGFSKAYLFGKTGSAMMSYEKPKNWGIYVGKVKAYDGKRYITLDNISNLNIGDGIEVWNNSNESPSTIISEIIGNKVGRIVGKINIGDKVYKTSDKSLNAKARESYSRGFVKHSPININLTIKEKETIKLSINGFDYDSGIVPEVSKNNPLTKDTIIKQLSKTGTTPFIINEFLVTLGNNLFLPISTLNDIRRKALQEYENNFVSKISREIKNITPKKIEKHVSENHEVSVFFNNIKNEFLNLKNVDNAYFTLKDAIKNIDLIKEFNCKKYVLFPIVTTNNYIKLIKENIANISKFVDGFVLSNIGQLEFVKDLNTQLVANYTFNIFNTYSICLLKDLGFSKVIISPELTKKQIDNLGDTLPRELIVYGNTVVMTSEHCTVGSVVGGLTANTNCSKPCIKENKYYLKDRLNILFRVIPDNINCTSQILNSKVTSMESKGINIDSIRIDILDETTSEIQNIINIHKNGDKLSGDDYTNGHINRSV